MVYKYENVVCVLSKVKLSLSIWECKSKLESLDRFIVSSDYKFFQRFL